MKMYLFIQDHSWAGCLVAVAPNEARARELMEKAHTYDKDRELECFPVTEEMSWENYGDS